MKITAALTMMVATLFVTKLRNPRGSYVVREQPWHNITAKMKENKIKKT